MKPIGYGYGYGYGYVDGDGDGYGYGNGTVSPHRLRRHCAAFKRQDDLSRGWK